MKRFIEGADRSQTTLLPECLDDWVDENNPVRAVDAFVDALDLAKLGFKDVAPAATASRSANTCRTFASFSTICRARATTSSAVGAG